MKTYSGIAILFVGIFFSLLSCQQDPGAENGQANEKEKVTKTGNGLITTVSREDDNKRKAEDASKKAGKKEKAKATLAAAGISPEQAKKAKQALMPLLKKHGGAGNPLKKALAEDRPAVIQALQGIITEAQLSQLEQAMNNK